ncbi:MAG: ABC transporter permease [Alphaproteobacteria bacterium]|nr:ABC transporter permease [Alphaproteobacteria bacterium]
MKPIDRKQPWILPILGGLSILLARHLVILLFDVQEFVAPSPLAAITTLIEKAPVLAKNFWPTAIEAVAGFIIGNSLAILLAVVFVHSKILEAAYFPVAVFFNTIPILALAPILVLIFGLGMLPKIVIAAIICFFPTLVNMIRGLESVSAAELELMHVLNASRSEIFWRLRVPRSLPFLFAALRIASTTSVVGAIVGEWIGANSGLGALIIQATFNYQPSLLYATLFVSSGLALLFFAIVVFVERRVLDWR